MPVVEGRIAPHTFGPSEAMRLASERLWAELRDSYLEELEGIRALAPELGAALIAARKAMTA